MSYSGLRQQDLIACLKPVVKEISSYCGYDVSLKLDSDTDEGEIRYDTLHPVGSIGHDPISVTLGAQELVANINSVGVIRDEDFVWTVFQAYHEATHARYLTNEFMRNDGISDDTKIMAEDLAIGICFPEYKDMIYSNDTNEIHADRTALKRTKELFDELATKDARFAAIDIDAVLVSQEQRRRGDLHGVWTGLAPCATVDDMLRVYDSAFDRAKYGKCFNIVAAARLTDKSPEFKTLLRDQNTVLSVANAANGIDQRNILCEYVGRHEPSCFRGLICIKNDYCKGVKGAFEKGVGKLLGVKSRTWNDLTDAADGARDSGSTANDHDFDKS